MNKEQLEKQIELYKKNIADQQESLETLRAELEKLKQSKTGRCKPNEGEKYFYISNIGFVYEGEWTNHPMDQHRFAFGNCFRTEEETEFEVERFKVIAELSEYASEFVVGGDNWSFYWDYDSEEIQYAWSATGKYLKLYFPSKLIAHKAIQTVGEDRVKKYYLGVE